LLMRTSFACVSVATRSELLSRAASRLNDRGSLRIDAVASPPRTRRAGELDVDAGWERQPAATTAISAAAQMRVTIRMCPVKSCPTGQEIGRSKTCATDAVEAILCANCRVVT